MPQSPTDFFTSCSEPYEQPTRLGYTSVDVLPLLTGKPWDEVALAFVHSLRPSCIRVIKHNHAETTDARTWRVTVYLDEKELIESISQEVQVGLPEGVQHGHALSHALKHGLSSEQVEWHRNASCYVIGNRGLYKCENGKAELVKFPSSK
jgi:hypothetical protein